MPAKRSVASSSQPAFQLKRGAIGDALAPPVPSLGAFVRMNRRQPALARRREFFDSGILLCHFAEVAHMAVGIGAESLYRKRIDQRLKLLVHAATRRKELILLTQPTVFFLQFAQAAIKDSWLRGGDLRTGFYRYRSVVSCVRVLETRHPPSILKGASLPGFFLPVRVL